ncbi:MAG: RNA polymerase sigma factor [Sedimentisphaerales bacterium]|nr:RNA polymerase sigma factor [Sedimentisphaerales bacterium]
MDLQLHQIELIRGAQRGNKECLDQLAQQARGRLHTYVFRLTQQEDLTQEIVQESLLEMFKVIGKLRKADRFWPWLYGIATNKLRRYYRTESTQRRVAISSVQKKRSYKDRQDGFENLVGEELKQIVSGAMKKLKTRHKAVLVMRCYDDMPYSDIAECMGCSEFSTRMLFMRAKRALQKELSRNGFGKGSLLAALLLFGKITAPSEAAAAQVSVTAATVNVGLLAGIVGVATTKTAIILTTAGALTIGTVAVTTMPSKHNVEGPHPAMTITRDIELSNSEQEYRYYFPLGPSEPLMLRAHSGSHEDNSYWQILQNKSGNYYYHDNTVYINNYRMYARDLSVTKIPTDKPELTDFICRIDGSKNTISPVSAKGEGLLVIAARSESTNGNRPWVIRHYNELDEDYFQADWPTTAKVIDNRDQMHKRGWTFFKISGQINGENVSGSGRIPFVFSTSEQNSPWLKLQVGSLMIVDTYKNAYTYHSPQIPLGIYEGGSFFKGLGRPWMGLHTIDTVRRDAAEERISFNTEYTQGERYATVEIIRDNIKIIYKIDLEKDVVDEITFSNNEGSIGNLKFSYLQSIDDINEEFAVPRIPRQQTNTKDSSGILWLVQLLEDSL